MPAVIAEPRSPSERTAIRDADGNARPIPRPAVDPMPQLKGYSLVGTPLGGVGWNAYASGHDWETGPLGSAWAAHQANPADADLIVALGRAYEELRLYKAAVAVYGEGLYRHPDNVRMLRHRGHRRISLFRFDDAATDLSLAAELIEIHGVVDAPGLGSTDPVALAFEVFYHLGHAHFMAGAFDRARVSYERALDFVGDDEMLVDVTQWLYVTLLRLGRETEARHALAPITEDLAIEHLVDYHEALLMAKGLRQPSEVLSGAPTGSVEWATRAFAVAQWRLGQGDVAGALDLYAQILLARRNGVSCWPAFGYIGVEAELARWPVAEPERYRASVTQEQGLGVGERTAWLVLPSRALPEGARRRPPGRDCWPRADVERWMAAERIRLHGS